MIYFASEEVSEIILNANKKEQLEIYNLYNEQISNTNDIVTDVFQEIIFDNFKEEPFLTHKVEMIHQILKHPDINEFMTRSTLERLIEALKLQKVSNKAIALQLKPYQDYTPVIDFMIEQSLDSKDYAQAIELIQKGRQSKYPGIKNRYSSQLIQMYKDMKHPEYLYLLFDYVTTESPNDYEAYEQLKNSYKKEEWVQVREYLFSKMDNDILPQYLMEEALYDRVMKGFEASQFPFSWFQTVKDKMFEVDLERALRVYEQFLNRMATLVKDRKQYRELMQYLKEIKQIQGDLQIAERMESQWRLLYKNRPAMMDELNKVMGKKK